MNSNAPQAYKYESLLQPSGLVSRLSPIWPVSRFNWMGVWPSAWAFVTMQAAQQRMWKLPSIKRLCTLPFWASTSTDLKLSIQGCYENQMCFIYKSLCSPSQPPKEKKNCKQRMQIIFQIDRFMKMPVFILSFLRTRESHKWQFQKP